MCLALWGYLSGLDLSLWHDEAVTVDQIIEKGPVFIVVGPFRTNNHVLFSLLAWTVSTIAGPSEVAYRIGSVLPGLVAVGIVVYWLRTALGGFSAILYAVLAITSPVFFQMVRSARGYGLAFLASALLLVFSHRMVEAKRTSDVIWVIAAGLIGVATLPTFVIPFMISMLVVLVLTRTWRRVAVTILASGVLASGAYAARLPQLLAGSRQEFGAPLQWFEPAAAWVFHHFTPLMRLASMQNPRVDPNGPLRPFGPVDPSEVYLTLASFLVAISAMVWFIRFGSVKHRPVVILTLVPLFGTYIALAVLQFFILGRFVSFLSIHALVAIAAGISLAISRLREISVRLFRLGIAAAAAIVLVLVFSFLGWARSWHVTPFENFKVAAAIADSAGFDVVHTDSVRPAGLSYYLSERLQQVDPDALCSLDRFVFIHHPFRNEEDLPQCLIDASIRVTKVAQQGRGLYLSVFVRSASHLHADHTSRLSIERRVPAFARGPPAMGKGSAVRGAHAWRCCFF